MLSTQGAILEVKMKLVHAVWNVQRNRSFRKWFGSQLHFTKERFLCVLKSRASARPSGEDESIPDKREQQRGEELFVRGASPWVVTNADTKCGSQRAQARCSSSMNRLDRFVGESIQPIGSDNRMRQRSAVMTVVHPD